MLRKPQICRPARPRTCDVAHFGLNLHGAMEETRHHVALGVFLAPPLTLGASAHAVLPEIKPPEKLYTSITKFCHFCSKICFSFSQGSSAGRCREALGGPAGTHRSGSPHWKPWSQTTSCDQELILILCVSVASSLWTFPLHQPLPDGKSSSSAADCVVFSIWQWAVASAPVARHRGEMLLKVTP